MEKRSAQQQFDRQAEHYDRGWNQWSEEALQWLLDHSDCQPDDRVLDVGTGSGFTAFAFSPLAAWVTGADISTGMLKQARIQAEEQGLKNVTFVELPAESLEFEDGTFDLVTCRLAAHHFRSIPGFLGEAYRVLKPGGRLLLTDTLVPDGFPDLDRWQNELEQVRDTSHGRNHTSSVWKLLIESAGFQLKEIDSIGGRIPIVVSEWLTKGGCSQEQRDRVYALLAEAPQGASDQFGFEWENGQIIRIHWQRVVLKAIRAEGHQA